MSYVERQLLAAAQTAATHTDPATRERADRRAQAWVSHVVGVLSGAIRTGVRTPVGGLPAWVTLDVLHGGFASGAPAAGGRLADDERDLARDLGLPRTREALNAWHLTDDGRACLDAMLDDGRYTLAHPENAVLLVVAWLVRAGDHDEALALLSQVGAFMDRLRFYPAATSHDEAPADLVFRRSEAATRSALVSRTANARVEAQREALTVWAPFADELLALWWPAVDRADGPALPDATALTRAASRYRALAAQHTRCTSHTSRKTNLGVLVEATTRAATDRVLAPADLARAAHAARSMVRKRGLPTSDELARERAAHRVAVAAPSHAAVAHVVATRLDADATRRGLGDPAAVVGPVGVPEANAAVPAGTPVPDSVVRAVGLARQATVEELHRSGAVPSAEVLAELAPQLVGAQHAATYPDPALGALMARTYRAFRERRSLLLTDLSAQVRMTELPWVAAVDGHRRVDDGARDSAADALRRVGGLYLEWFPGTPLPNPLLVELEALVTQAGLDVPLVPELAADIFQDAFSARFVRASRHVADHAGPAYLAYYGLADDLRRLAPRGDDRTAFATLCRRRARAAGSGPSRWSVSRNGMVIEQSQLLTSHNLASLAALGVVVDPEAAVRGAFADVVRLARDATRAGESRRYLAMSRARAAGLAWRHVVWFAALLSPEAGRRLLRDLAATGREPAGLPGALARAVDDLCAAYDGTTPVRPLLGWSNGPHPLLG
ncbi:hypothetical protein [Antribacter gilvus]|uniref:hypothetical protein n=1 Tax=Antribacter gilvus TaxID=2304675 RepID=UPI000F76D657|nr:hypothetical protein [Antribacter gilvus]